jgi:UDP-N-acetylglucosamine 2-epimerase
MKRQKVLYLIFANQRTSGGGHFYSLKTLIEALEKYSNIDYKVVNMGKNYVKIIQELEKSAYVPIYRYNIIRYFSELKKLIEDFKPDVVHAFDQKSHYIGRLFSLIYKIPIIFTKCGGPNGNSFIPYADVFIHFSYENFIFYEKNKKFNNKSYLIPNRVSPVRPNDSRIQELKDEYDLVDNTLKLLRVSRFNPYYEHTLNQIYNLYLELKKIKEDVKLILVGKIQNKEYFELIKSKFQNDRNILLITDDKYTYAASELVDIANIVVGTGRGVMEASSLGKIVFCPNKASVLPQLLSHNTINKLLEFNFSERYSEVNQYDLIDIVNREQYYCSISQNIFESYFNINNVVNSFIDIYDFTNTKNKISLDFLIHSLWFFKPKFKFH